MEYILVKDYSMKCRLYPNKKQQEQLDTLFHGAASAHNMILHNLYDYKYCTESTDKEIGDLVHFPDFKAAGLSKNIKLIRDQNSTVSYLPSYAISGNSGIINDIKKGWEKTGKHPIEQWKYYKKINNIKYHFGPQFKSKYTRDLSFCYHVCWNGFNIVQSNANNKKENNLKNNNIGITISSANYHVDGYVKIKGWNEQIRFDENHEMNFYDYLKASNFNSNRVFIRFKKERQAYYVIISLKNVYKPVNIAKKRIDGPGLDLGEITLATSSYGDDIKSLFDYYPNYQNMLDKLDFYEEKMSKQWGYKNPLFKEAREKDWSIKPSKQYLATEKKYNRLLRKRNDRIDTYYDQMTSDIISKYNTIYMETLNIKDMYWYKEKQDAEQTGKNEKTDSKT